MLDNSGDAFTGASFDRVGKDYSGYVAFDKQRVTIAE
jgi:hypothetical protein